MCGTKFFAYQFNSSFHIGVGRGRKIGGRISLVALVFFFRAGKKWDIQGPGWSYSISWQLILNMQKSFAEGASPAPGAQLGTPVPRPWAPEKLFSKKTQQMWFINYSLHVKRRGDFGTFCLVLARVSRELNLNRRCLTCFCLAWCSPHTVTEMLKNCQKSWFINHPQSCGAGEAKFFLHI